MSENISALRNFSLVIFFLLTTQLSSPKYREVLDFENLYKVLYKYCIRCLHFLVLSKTGSGYWVLCDWHTFLKKVCCCSRSRFVWFITHGVSSVLGLMYCFLTCSWSVQQDAGVRMCKTGWAQCSWCSGVQDLCPHSQAQVRCAGRGHHCRMTVSAQGSVHSSAQSLLWSCGALSQHTRGC